MLNQTRIIIWMPNESKRLRLTRVYQGQRYAITVTALGPIVKAKTADCSRPSSGTSIAPSVVDDEYVPVFKTCPIPPAEAYGKCEVFRLTPRKLKSRLAKELRAEKREDKAREALAKVQAQKLAAVNAFSKKEERVVAPVPEKIQTFVEKVSARKAERETTTLPTWVANWLKTQGSLPLTIACLNTCSFTHSVYNTRTGHTTMKPVVSSLKRNIDDVWYLVESLASLIQRSPKLDLSMHYCKCANCSSLAQPTWKKGAWNFELVQPGQTHDNGDGYAAYKRKLFDDRVFYKDIKELEELWAKYLPPHGHIVGSRPDPALTMQYRRKPVARNKGRANAKFK